MPTMSDSELNALVNQAEREAVKFNGEFMAINEKLLNYYLGRPFGDEKEEESKVISTDVADVIESDMPSLVRVFLGNEFPLEFQANTSNPREIQEAEDKTAYINWIVRNQKNSFKILHDWMKDADLQKLGVVKYAYEETEGTKIEEYDGLNDDELGIILDDIERDLDKDSKLDIVEQDQEGDSNYIKIRITQLNKRFTIRNIATEDFYISKNATSKDDAELVGDRTYMSRGDLIADGFDESLVRSLPSSSQDSSESGERTAGTLKQIRFRQQGGEKATEDIKHWASENIEVFNLYMLVDFDGDGIPERRHIIKAGNRIIHNEQFDIVPYSIMSSILMPHSAIGRSRGEVTLQIQRTKSVLYRQIMNNIYRVNNARTVVNDDVTNIDDLLTVRPNGIVRTDGDPRQAVAQLETPYIGDRALQVIQYIDSTRAQTTGTYVANQGLDSDQLYKETATRFNGIQEAGAAKVELVARVFAETGFKDLYEGLAWLVAHYQNDEKEIRVLGKPMTINPKAWRNNHSTVPNVGLAAGDNEQTLNNLGTVLTIQNQMLQQGSPIVDQKKVYNVLSKALKAMGFAKVQDFANDPEIPEQTLLAKNEKLMQTVEQLQQQMQGMQNPLVQPELIKAQAKLEEAQSSNALNAAKLVQDQDQFEQKLDEEQRQFNEQMLGRLAELELKFNKDVPGSPI